MSQNKTLKKIPEGMVNLLENAIASLMMESKVPGLSIAVVINDQVIYSKGFGARNLELNLPATPNTIYGFGSCTKSYTALAIMQLVQDGKINLNDPINKYLDFKLGTKKNPIAIHHLLTHSSGNSRSWLS
jgi:CubicO group peptidase (beta-lactamase class C family)